MRCRRPEQNPSSSQRDPGRHFQTLGHDAAACRSSAVSSTPCSTTSSTSSKQWSYRMMSTRVPSHALHPAGSCRCGHIHRQDFQRAVQVSRQGKFDQAEALCRAILAKQRGCFDALQLLGVLHHQQGHDIEALPCLEAALKLRPGNLAILVDLGLIYRRPPSVCQGARKL